MAVSVNCAVLKADCLDIALDKKEIQINLHRNFKNLRKKEIIALGSCGYLRYLVWAQHILTKESSVKRSASLGSHSN